MTWGTDEPAPSQSSSYYDELAERYGPPAPAPLPEPTFDAGFGDVDPGTGSWQGPTYAPSPAPYELPAYQAPAYEPPTWRASPVEDYQDYSPPTPTYTPPPEPPDYQPPEWHQPDTAKFYVPPDAADDYGGAGLFGMADQSHSQEDLASELPQPPDSGPGAGAAPSASSTAAPWGVSDVGGVPAAWSSAGDGSWLGPNLDALPKDWSGGIPSAISSGVGAVTGALDRFYGAYDTLTAFGRQGRPTLHQQFEQSPALAAANLFGPSGIAEQSGVMPAVMGLPGYLGAVGQGIGQSWSAPASGDGADSPLSRLQQMLAGGFSHAKEQGEALAAGQPEDYPYQHAVQTFGAQVLPDVGLELLSGGFATPALAAKYGRYAPKVNEVAKAARAVVNPVSMLPREAQSAIGALYAGQLAGAGLDLPEEQRNLVSAATALVPKVGPHLAELPGVSTLAQPARSTRQLLARRGYADAMAEARDSGLLADAEAIRDVLTNVPQDRQPYAFKQLAAAQGAGLSTEASAALPSYLPEWLKQYDRLGPGSEREALEAAAGKQAGIIRETDEFNNPLNPLERFGRWAGETPVLKQLGQAAGDVTSAFKQGVLLSGRFFGQNTADAAAKNMVQGVGVDVPGSQERLRQFLQDYGIHPPAAIDDSVNEQIGHAGSELLNSVPKVGDVMQRYVNPVVALPSDWNRNLETAFRLPLYTSTVDKVTQAAVPDLQQLATGAAKVSGLTADQAGAFQQAIASTGGKLSAAGLRDLAEQHGISPASVDYLGHSWADLLKQASAAGEQAVADTHFDYGNRTVFDTALGQVLPFSTWATRNPAFMAELMAQHPALGTAAMRYDQEADRQKQERGLPQTFKSKVDTGIDLGGDRLYTDVAPIINPLAGQVYPLHNPQRAPTFNQLVGTDIPIIGEAKPGEWLARLNQLGISPYPWLMAVPQATGALGSRPPQGGTFPVQRLGYGLTADQKFTPDGVLEQKVDDALQGSAATSPLTPDRTLNSRWAQRIAELAYQQTGKPIDQTPALLAQAQDPNSPLARAAYDDVRRQMATEAALAFFVPVPSKLLSPEAAQIDQARAQARQSAERPDFNDPSRAYATVYDSEPTHALRLQLAEYRDLGNDSAAKRAYRDSHPELGAYFQNHGEAGIQDYIRSLGLPASTFDRTNGQPPPPSTMAPGGAVGAAGVTAQPGGPSVPFGPKAPSPSQLGALRQLGEAWDGINESRRVSGLEPLPSLGEVFQQEGVGTFDGQLTRGWQLVRQASDEARNARRAGSTSAPVPLYQATLPGYHEASSQGPALDDLGQVEAPAPGGGPGLLAFKNASGLQNWDAWVARYEGERESRRINGQPPLPDYATLFTRAGATTGEGMVSALAQQLNQAWSEDRGLRVGSGATSAGVSPRGVNSGRYSGGSGTYNRSTVSGGGGGTTYADARIDRAKGNFQTDLDAVNQRLKVAGLPVVPPLDEFASNEVLAGDELLNRGYQALREANNQLAAQPAVRALGERVAAVNQRLVAAGRAPLDPQALMAQAAERYGVSDQRAVVDAAFGLLAEQTQGLGAAAGAARSGTSTSSTAQGWLELRARQEEDARQRLTAANAEYDALRSRQAAATAARQQEQQRRDFDRGMWDRLYTKQAEDGRAAQVARLRQQEQERTTRATERGQQQAAVDALYRQRDELRYRRQLALAQAALAGMAARNRVSGGGAQAFYAPQGFATAWSYGGTPTVGRASGRGFTLTPYSGSRRRSRL